MFRRTSSEPETPATTDKVGGKGRPTPTRKEAEAAARARAKVPRTRKEQMAAQRAARGETSQKMRQAMKTGDERYLPARDRGPVRRFLRDYVDARFSFIELMVPLLIVSMVLSYTGAGPARQHDPVHHDHGDRLRHRHAALPPAPRARDALPRRVPPRAPPSTR